jgi:hypothetical protein
MTSEEVTGAGGSETGTEQTVPDIRSVEESYS